MSSEKTLLAFIKIMLKWKKVIFFTVLIAGVASVIVSLLMPNYYRSTVVFKPANLATIDRVFIFNTEIGDQGINYFGDRHDINRVLTVANSSPMIDYVINHFNLAEHYGIDTTKPRWRSRVQSQFLSNFRAIQTERDNVEISVMDRDPEMAANIANNLMQALDDKNSGFVAGRNQRILNQLTAQMQEREKELDALSVLLGSMRDTTMANYRMTSLRQIRVMEDYEELRKLHDQYTLSLGSNFSSIFPIEQAYPAETKHKPVRWLIVVSTVFGALLISITGILIIEKYKDIQQALANDK